MILVQHGRGGWVNSRSTLAKAMTMAIAGVVVMLAGGGLLVEEDSAGRRHESQRKSTW